MSIEPGGSGAGGTVEPRRASMSDVHALMRECDQLCADLEAARAEIERLTNANALWSASMTGMREGYDEAFAAARAIIESQAAEIERLKHDRLT